MLTLFVLARTLRPGPEPGKEVTKEVRVVHDNESSTSDLARQPGDANTAHQAIRARSAARASSGTISPIPANRESVV
jgi:hypothetical protein